MALCLDFFKCTRIALGLDANPRTLISRYAWVVIAVVLASGPERCEAARLTQMLTAQDLAQPLLLDQNGNPIALASGHGTTPLVGSGSIPTYMAYSLHGGEHLPPGLAVITTAPTGLPGVVGPLDFSQSVKAEIDAALATSRAAEIAAPGGDYLIAILPRRATSVLAAPVATSGISPQAAATTPAQVASSPSGLLPGPLGNWLSTGSSKLLSWTNQGLTDLETLLDLKRNKALAHSRPQANRPSLNLEAQVLTPPAPAPIPEPATWVSFGIILGAAATTGRFWNRKRADSGDSP